MSRTNHKIENIMLRFMHFDIAADTCGDKNAEKHKDDGLCPIDILMHGGGMFRGSIVTNHFVRLNTYIPPDKFYPDQVARQQEMTKEFYHWKRKGLYP